MRDTNDFAGIINASSGDSPHLPHHVRDEEALIRRLPPCVLPPIARETATRVELATYPVVLWIRDIEHAEEMDVPEPTWLGWEWSPVESLWLCVDRGRHLPRLGTLTLPTPSHYHVVVAGSPMRVRLSSPGDPEWRGEGFAGEVSGFLDETTRFTAMAVAPTAERRDELLAMVATMRRLPTDS